MTIIMARHKLHKALTNKLLRQNTKSLHMQMKMNYKEMSMTKHIVRQQKIGHNTLAREHTLQQRARCINITI